MDNAASEIECSATSDLVVRRVVFIEPAKPASVGFVVSPAIFEGPMKNDVKGQATDPVMTT
jgi:hypothetical protein